MGRQMTFGVMVGNRGFFPSHLATSGRLEMIAALEAAGIKPVVLTPEETAHGAVETYKDAKKCAALFKTHAAEIDGIIITLPNFGEERGLADALRLANLQVPVLIQATPDHAGKMSDCVPTRQLLRQDVDLQQPETVWDSLLADEAAYGGAGLSGVQGRPREDLRRMPHGEAG